MVLDGEEFAVVPELPDVDVGLFEGLHVKVLFDGGGLLEDDGEGVG